MDKSIGIRVQCGNHSKHGLWLQDLGRDGRRVDPGQIAWTLRKAAAHAPPEFDGRVGKTATEFVRGQMKGDGLLVLHGDRKRDPNGMTEIGQSRLAVADNGQVTGGITLNKGPWTGQLIAMRAEPSTEPGKTQAVP